MKHYKGKKVETLRLSKEDKAKFNREQRRHCDHGDLWAIARLMDEVKQEKKNAGKKWC